MITVEDLRRALENAPNDMEIVVGLFGNQHDPYDYGIAQRMDDGMFEIPEDNKFDDDREKNFLITG